MDEFDTLTLYHHTTCDFEKKLQHLLSLLKLPKEYNLTDRFKEIEQILDKTFRLELLHRLQLISPSKPSETAEKETSNNHHTHPQLLLHLWCLLGLTDSITYIANYLELTEEEVQDLIKELHHTFSIDSLMSQILHYYKKDKEIKEAPDLQRKQEFLGVQYALVPKDTIEDRKKRLKRKHGHLAKNFDLIS